jgi:hypothetical protein
MNTQVIVREEPTEAQSLVQVIARAASDPTVDVAKMERLLAMHERITGLNAEKQFNEAMRAAQEEMPNVVRDAVNESTRSRYARLETVSKRMDPVIAKHGFSMSFGTADCPRPDRERITCVLSHVGGHSRTYQADVPLDMLGMKGQPNKTATHAFGSTMSYGRRYLKLMIFDVTLANEDTDAQGDVDDEAPPAEFAQFWQEMTDAAKQGTLPLQAKWGAAPKGCRPYVSKHYATEWAALKDAAAKADHKGATL